MKLLLLSAIRSSKHLLLAITALVLLICLTMANQTERCALGMMANNGTDFFKLFSDGKSSNVSKADIENRWSQIDENKTDFKGDLGVNYHFNKFYISSMLSLGKFPNINLALHYKIF